MAMTQAQRHEAGNWMTGFQLYVDDGEYSQCENDAQREGWLAARWAHQCYMKAESKELATEREVHIL